MRVFLHQILIWQGSYSWVFQNDRFLFGILYFKRLYFYNKILLYGFENGVEMIVRLFLIRCKKRFDFDQSSIPLGGDVPRVKNVFFLFLDYCKIGVLIIWYFGRENDWWRPFRGKDYPFRVFGVPSPQNWLKFHLKIEKFNNTQICPPKNVTTLKGSPHPNYPKGGFGGAEPHRRAKRVNYL
jgi:hypothetical protein